MLTQNFRFLIDLRTAYRKPASIPRGPDCSSRDSSPPNAIATKMKDCVSPRLGCRYPVPERASSRRSTAAFSRLQTSALVSSSVVPLSSTLLGPESPTSAPSPLRSPLGASASKNLVTSVFVLFSHFPRRTYPGLASRPSFLASFGASAQLSGGSTSSALFPPPGACTRSDPAYLPVSSASKPRTRRSSAFRPPGSGRDESRAVSAPSPRCISPDRLHSSRESVPCSNPV